LEEAVRQLWAMHDEHREVVIELRALQNFATQVRHLVLKGSDETSSLSLVSSTMDLIEGRLDVAATNGVHWGPVGADYHLTAFP
jgi:hypothetical protein